MGYAAHVVFCCREKDALNLLFLLVSTPSDDSSSSSSRQGLHNFFGTQKLHDLLGSSVCCMPCVHKGSILVTCLYKQPVSRHAADLAMLSRAVLVARCSDGMLCAGALDQCDPSLRLEELPLHLHC